MYYHIYIVVTCWFDSVLYFETLIHTKRFEHTIVYFCCNAYAGVIHNKKTKNMSVIF